MECSSLVARQMMECLSVYQEIRKSRKNEMKAHSILDIAFSKRLPVETDQPSTSSAETVRPN